MLRINFANDERSEKALENREQNYLPAVSWIERHKTECFVMRDGNEKHSLKAFISSDKKIVWFEFRSTTLGNSSQPIALSIEPSELQTIMNREWQNMKSKIKLNW